MRGVRRALYLTLAGLFFGLAYLGVLLPGLPATPFLLLTSFFLVRSSPALYEKLLRSKVFGPLLQDWRRHRALRPRVKRVALIGCSSAVAVSAWLTRSSPAVLTALLLAGAVGFIVVWRLPVIEEDAGRQDSGTAGTGA